MILQLDAFGDDDFDEDDYDDYDDDEEDEEDEDYEQPVPLGQQRTPMRLLRRNKTQKNIKRQVRRHSDFAVFY